MSWHGLHGHDAIVDRFRRGLRQGRLASTFLLVGPAGVGKYRFAVTLAQALLCDRRSETELEPCGQCPACQQVAARSHPDLLEVGKPVDKNFIPVELLIGDRDHRMQEGLCHDIALKPYAGGRRVAIIRDADFLNPEGANCLLKTLEEPPPRSVLLLIGTSEQRQLPTIRSRCQVVRFAPLSVEILEQVLLEQGVVEDRKAARELALLGAGSLERAIELSDPELRSFREHLLEQLASPPWSHAEIVEAANATLNRVKEGAPRRARFRQIVNFALDLYQNLHWSQHIPPEPRDAPLQSATARLLEAWSGGDAAAAQAIDACLQALSSIDSMANQATLLEWWLDELAQLTKRS